MHYDVKYLTWEELGKCRREILGDINPDGTYPALPSQFLLGNKNHSYWSFKLAPAYVNAVKGDSAPWGNVPLPELGTLLTEADFTDAVWYWEEYSFAEMIDAHYHSLTPREV